jgi:hypothetical protein
MSERRREPAALEETQRARFDDIDHDRVARLSIAQEGDDAVATRAGALHHALVTADPQVTRHARTLRRGCDRTRSELLDDPRRAAPPALHRLDPLVERLSVLDLEVATDGVVVERAAAHGGRHVEASQVAAARTAVARGVGHDG